MCQAIEYMSCLLITHFLLCNTSANSVCVRVFYTNVHNMPHLYVTLMDFVHFMFGSQLNLLIYTSVLLCYNTEYHYVPLLNIINSGCI